ncbi:MAG: hypothetical protein AAGF23_23735, partial [Acidobacteriota bacterium]
MTRLTDLLRHRREPQSTWQLHRFEAGEVRMWRITLRWKSVRTYAGTVLDRLGLDPIEEHAFEDPAEAARRCGVWRRGKEEAGWTLVGAEVPSTGLRYWIRDPQKAWLPQAAHVPTRSVDDQLLLAARLHRPDLVAAAIEQGADLDARSRPDGHTALELALASGASGVVRTLLDAGARLDGAPHPRRR